MSSDFRAPKGVPEYFPPVSAGFLYVRDALAAPAQRSGYGYIELPVFEETALFERGVGESTDVVSKEMYTFTDRGDRSITLRPEGTAGVMRAVVEHGLHRGPLPVKLWYAGAFFRAERPQRGRYRQLQQVGLEAIGSTAPALDAEVIALANEGFVSLGLRSYELQLTSLGCAQCRPIYRELLRAFLLTCDLDEATRLRAGLNPLRVLDDKREAVQRQLVTAPLPVDHLCADCTEHFASVCSTLDLLNVAWVANPRLVRGLDYYTRTAFEFTHRGLGAQSGIGGGGRYDGLMASLGGSDLSGIGFGLGVDRTLLAVEAEGINLPIAPTIDVVGIATSVLSQDALILIIQRLRHLGVRADIAYDSRSLKAGLKTAHRVGARWAMILGDDELAEGLVAIKDLRTGEQVHHSNDAIERWAPSLQWRAQSS